MSALADLRRYGRFALRLRTFLKHPITLGEARATVVHRVAEREASFLRVVERAIFGNPRSPYLPLLRRAGCGYADLRTMVSSRAEILRGPARGLRTHGSRPADPQFQQVDQRRHGVARARHGADSRGSATGPLRRQPAGLPGG